MENPPSSPDSWSTVRTQFVRFSQSTTWPPGYQLSEGWFRHAIIDLTYWFTYKGKGEVTDLDTGVSYPMHAGVCLLMRPDKRYSASQIGSEGISNLYFHLNLLRQDGTVLTPAEWPDLPFCTEVADVEFFNAASRRLLGLLRRSREVDYPARAEALKAAEYLFKGIVLDLCHLNRLPQTSSSALHHQRAVEKALRALDENSCQYPTVEAWAATSGYSASHFRTLCVKYTGKSPMEHLILARIKLAREYLRSSSLTIGMIADQLGYENAHYFSRQFRKQTGMTASEYRQAVIASRLKESQAAAGYEASG